MTRVTQLEKTSAPQSRNDKPLVYLRRKEVLQRFRLSNSTLYRLIGDGLFPRPVKLGERISAWDESELLDWAESRPRSCCLKGGA
ncbi:MAG: AlpA family phage regulatory protein [Betaproteobacteria bacterium]|nr:AlpA family phage regulatory protein [Betaproteobacteria bacterium]